MPLAARHFSRPGPVWVGLFLWLVHWVVTLGAIATFALMFLVSRSYGKLFLGLVGAYVVMLAIRWIHSRAVSCPLCHGRILHGSKCHKHRDARRRKLLGYTGSLFLDVILMGRFTCMYCGTPFRLKR